MVYGSATQVQYYVWNGVKASTPSIVTAALQFMTSKINGMLNITSDLTTVPQTITDIAELGAAGIIKQGGTEHIERPDYYYTMAIKMLEEYIDNTAPSTKGKWGNIEWL